MRNEASEEYSITSKSAAQDSEVIDDSRGNNDRSLIYQLMQKKEGKQVRDQRVQQIHRKPERVSSSNDIENDSSEYGQLLEVNELFVKDENYNREIIKNFHQHVEDEHKIKVFINPNPQKKIEVSPTRQTPQKTDPIKAQKLAENQTVKAQMKIDLQNLNYQQSGKRNEEREKIIKEENVIEDFLSSEPNQQKRSGSKDLRIREIARLKNGKKEEVPATTRKRTTVSRQSNNSSRRRESNKDSNDQMDSFDEFKEYKKRKKEKGVKTLIRKVQSLEKKVKELKIQKQELQKMKIISKIIPPVKNKHYGIASNLISIKVETDNLLIKEDIMSELKKLKQKVEHLDNKASEKPRPIDHYESLSPANMAESKLEQTSNLIYSQAREKNKMTGKIFKKSQTKSSGVNERPNHQQSKEARQNIKQQSIPLQVYEKQDKIANISDITEQKPRSAIQISREMQKNRKSMEPQSKKVEQFNSPNSHFQEYSKESLVPAGLKKASSEMPIKEQNKQHKQKLIQNRQKRKQLQHKQHPPKPQKTQAQEARGFVRSGFRVNNTTPTKAKQEDEQSLKMLEFDTGKQKFMVDSHNTQEDIKFTKGASKEISNFQAAAELIPNVPNITRFPNYDTSQQQLVQMGKELFNVFGVNKINDDQTVLKVKKYKNCTYFGIDSTSNILLHYQGRIYFGGWKEFMNGQGEKSGDGVQYQQAKFLYKGQFRDGKRNGQGILKVNNSSQKSSIYIGQFIDGMKHGQGKQFDENGLKYEGQWKEGKKDGFGKLILGLNEKYEGIFEKGLKNGHGTQFFKNGDQYQGEYLAGKFHGKGSYYWSNGSIYEGQFTNGMRNGKGIWRSNNNHGDTYKGQYENDMKHGYGIYSWANGSSYQGNFNKDQKHGKGKLTHQNGKASNLQWENGNVVAKANEQTQMLSNANIRNYSKSLPINKNVYASKQRQREKVKNQNPIINNEMLKTLKSSSVSNMPKGVSQPFNHQQRNQQSRPQPFIRLYEMTERPMTSKSMSSISNNQFRIERKSLGNGLPKDPPYRGIRPTNNIINF